MMMRIGEMKRKMKGDLWFNGGGLYIFFMFLGKFLFGLVCRHEE